MCDVWYDRQISDDQQLSAAYQVEEAQRFDRVGHRHLRVSHHHAALSLLRRIHTHTHHTKLINLPPHPSSFPLRSELADHPLCLLCFYILLVLSQCLLSLYFSLSLYLSLFAHTKFEVVIVCLFVFL